MLSHQCKLFKSWYILFPLGCIVNLDRCVSSKISFFSLVSFGNIIRFWNLNIPFNPKLKSDFSKVANHLKYKGLGLFIGKPKHYTLLEISTQLLSILIHQRLLQVSILIYMSQNLSTRSTLILRVKHYLQGSCLSSRFIPILKVHAYLQSSYLSIRLISISQGSRIFSTFLASCGITLANQAQPRATKHGSVRAIVWMGTVARAGARPSTVVLVTGHGRAGMPVRKGTAAHNLGAARVRKKPGR